MVIRAKVSVFASVCVCLCEEGERCKEQLLMGQKSERRVGVAAMTAVAVVKVVVDR